MANIAKIIQSAALLRTVDNGPPPTYLVSLIWLEIQKSFEGEIGLRLTKHILADAHQKEAS